MIGFVDAISRYYKNYFKFYGRASRSEFWWPFLMRTLVYIGLFTAIIIIAASEMRLAGGRHDGVSIPVISLLSIGGLFLLLHIIPSYSVAARRFHDLDCTGWLVLVFVIANAIIGLTAIAQLIWFAMRGTQGRNQYGPDPYENEAEVFR